MPDLRAAIVQWAEWAVQNKSLFQYFEARPFSLYEPTPQRHIVGDCSAFVCWTYFMAKAPDPMGFGYSGEGNTETLSQRGQKVSVGQVLPGDVVVYNVGHPLSTQHTAPIVQGGSDPLTVSHGSSREPGFIHVSQDGRPATYYRFLPSSSPAPSPIPTPVPVPIPSPIKGAESMQAVVVGNTVEVYAVGTDAPNAGHLLQFIFTPGQPLPAVNDITNLIHNAFPNSTPYTVAP